VIITSFPIVPTYHRCVEKKKKEAEEGKESLLSCASTAFVLCLTIKVGAIGA
jgi:hypothetical protein